MWTRSGRSWSWASAPVRSPPRRCTRGSRGATRSDRPLGRGPVPPPWTAVHVRGPGARSSCLDMAARPPQIVAFGGGGFSMEAGNPLLDDYVLGLTGAVRPKVCFLPTASGDADHYIVRFYRRFAAVADTSHVSLFRRDKGAGAVEGNLEAHLLQQDLIYVGGGSVLSLLGTWRAHGLDTILKRAWRRVVLLCGLSAGSLCWFSEALTAFHGPPEPVRGLGLLPHSNCVHYDGEAVRGEVFRD